MHANSENLKLKYCTAFHVHAHIHARTYTNTHTHTHTTHTHTPEAYRVRGNFRGM